MASVSLILSFFQVRQARNKLVPLRHPELLLLLLLLLLDHSGDSDGGDSASGGWSSTYERSKRKRMKAEW